MRISKFIEMTNLILLTCCLVAIFPLATFGQCWNSARDYEPVVLKGSDLSLLLGSPINELFLYAFNATQSSWSQIPCQIDERDNTNDYWETGKNGFLDNNDELVFMAKDMADQALTDSWIDNENSKLNDRLEIKLSDPLNPDEFHYVYLYRSSTLTLDDNLADYVTYIPNATYPSEDTVQTVSYKEGNNRGGLPDYLAIDVAAGGNGLDILDRQKVRVTLTYLIFTFPLNEDLLITFPPEIKFKDGRIRIIRDAKWDITLLSVNFQFSLQMFFYAYSLESGGITKEFKQSDQVSYFRQSLDLNENAVGMSFFNQYNLDTIKIDGIADTPIKTMNDNNANWLLITGEPGSILTLFSLTPIGDSRQLYYKDNLIFDRADTGDGKSFGDIGVVIESNSTSYIVGTVGISYKQYYLAAHQPVELGDSLAQYFENPMQLTTNSTGFVPVELASFSAKVLESNAVALSWTTLSESNNYGFEVQRKAEFEKEWATVSFVAGHGTNNSPQIYYYTDENITENHYSYRLKQIDFDGSFVYSETLEIFMGVPPTFQLSQNYPNPFNPETTIRYGIPDAKGESVAVELNIYNVLGDKICTLVNKQQASGYYRAQWDGKDDSGRMATAGTYLYQLKAGHYLSSKKMTLIR